MRRHSKLTAMLLAVPALVVGVLVAMPSQAVTYTGAEPSLQPIAVKTDQYAAFWIQCHSSTTCVGTASVRGNYGSYTGTDIPNFPPDTNYGVNYRIPARSGKYVVLRMSPQQKDALYAYSGFSYTNGPKLNLRLAERSPSVKETVTKVEFVKRVPEVSLHGTVSGPGMNTRVKQATVTLWGASGVQPRRIKTVDVDSSGHYDFDELHMQLGTNNTAAGDFRLSITAHVDGNSADDVRTWYWRGDGSGNGVSWGGGTRAREASRVRLQANKDEFGANFPFGQISLNLSNNGSSSPTSGADVRVAGAPASMPTGAGLRDLDVPYCANDFGKARDDGGGHYSATFLPRSDSGADKRYAMRVDPAGGNAMTQWFGNDGNNGFASCIHARYYQVNDSAKAYQLLLAIPKTTPAVINAKIAPPTASLKGDVDFSGFSPDSMDRWVTIREVIPGRPILDSPIVKYTQASGSGAYDLGGVTPGWYYVEYGRVTGCAMWYSSRYPNNDAYFEGADRGAERWKAFHHLSDLPGNSVTGLESIAYNHGAKDYGKYNSTEPGRAGWMYREHCKSTGAGKYVAKWITGNDSQNTTIGRGATISGRVTRGTKSNKEMMVEVYSTQGTLVRRTDLTDGSGYFKVTGLASGNYNVRVNTDSWRGIGRSFSGTHTKRVSAGNSYSVGTLKASF